MSSASTPTNGVDTRIATERIALVITELDPGGAENCLTELALFLKKRSADVRVWSLGPEPRSPHDLLVQRLKSANIPLHFANARGMTSLPRVAGWLRRELLAFQPQVVQSMLWHANVLTAWALRGTQVVLFGGMRVSEPRRLRWPIERWAARRMHKLICVSELVREHAATKQRIPSDKLIVIPNGVPQSLWQASADKADADWSQLKLSPAASQARKLLFVGRLEPQKGVLPLIESMSQWSDNDPADPWRLIIMGRGSQLTAMQSLVKKLALTERVEFVGWQAHAPVWMAHSDIIVLPAEYEGMPNVLLEAMAVGKPFVAFAVEGVAQLISPADGYPPALMEAQLAAPRDWPAFIARLQRLMQDESLRSAIGDANRAHVAEHFALERQLERYASLYINWVPQAARQV